MAQSRGGAPPPVRLGDGAAEETPRGVWLLLGAIGGAKLGAIAVVVWSSRSAEAGVLVGVTTWYWLVVAGALLAGPLLFRRRLRRARAKREALRRAEWMLGDGGEAASTAVPLWLD